MAFHSFLRPFDSVFYGKFHLLIVDWKTKADKCLDASFFAEGPHGPQVSVSRLNNHERKY